MNILRKAQVKTREIEKLYKVEAAVFFFKLLIAKSITLNLNNITIFMGW